VSFYCSVCIQVTDIWVLLLKILCRNFNCLDANYTNNITVYMRTAMFCDVTQRIVVIPYRQVVPKRRQSRRAQISSTSQRKPKNKHNLDSLVVEWFKSVISVWDKEETHACRIGLEPSVLFSTFNVLERIICSTWHKFGFHTLCVCPHLYMLFKAD
jgi:hypothetical protein